MVAVLFLSLKMANSEFAQALLQSATSSLIQDCATSLAGSKREGSFGTSSHYVLTQDYLFINEPDECIDELELLPLPAQGAMVTFPSVNDLNNSLFHEC